MHTETALRMPPISSDNQQQTALICPAEYTWIGSVNVPSTKATHIRAAVPNLVEEWTASDIESLHIALGERSFSGRIPVIAVDKRWLHQLLLQQSEPPVATYVDALLLPWEAGGISVLIEGQRTLVRWDEHGAGAVDTENLEIFLTCLLKEQRNTKKSAIDITLWLSVTTNDAQLLITTLISTLEASYQIAVVTKLLEGSSLAFLQTQVPVARAPINLLQGEFASMHSSDQRWQQWRPVFWAAAICTALFILTNLLLGAVFQYQASLAHATNMALYKSLFPEDRRVVDIRRQTQQHLEQADRGSSSPFLDLFGQLAEAIRNTSSEAPLQLRSIMYENTGGTLSVELAAKRINDIDELNRRLNAQNTISKIQSVADDGSGVTSRLSLRGQKP